MPLQPAHGVEGFVHVVASAEHVEGADEHASRRGEAPIAALRGLVVVDLEQEDAVVDGLDARVGDDLRVERDVGALAKGHGVVRLERRAGK